MCLSFLNTHHDTFAYIHYATRPTHLTGLTSFPAEVFQLKFLLLLFLLASFVCPFSQELSGAMGLGPVLPLFPVLVLLICSFLMFVM